jgi:hypothetical protein
MTDRRSDLPGSEFPAGATTPCASAITGKSVLILELPRLVAAWFRSSELHGSTVKSHQDRMSHHDYIMNRGRFLGR